MSLKAPLLVNGQVLGYFYAKRTSGIEDGPNTDPDVVNTYQVDFQINGRTSGEPNRYFGGPIEHRYGDGPWMLMANAIQLYLSRDNYALRA